MMRLAALLLMVLLLAAAPARAEGTLDEGWQAIDRHDYAAAETIFESLAKSDNAEAIYALGWMRRSGIGMARDPAGAIPYFERAARLGDSRAQTDLGYAYDFGIGVAIDHDTAERWYSEGARSGNLLAMNNLAYSWSVAGRNLEQALDLARKVVAVRSEDGPSLDTLGWILYQLGRYDEAVPKLCRASVLDPGTPEIHIHLGDAYWRMGLTAAARAQWQQALGMADGPGQLSHTGLDYLNAQDLPSWRAMLQQRLAEGVPGVPSPAAPEKPFDDQCSVPTS
ncbi:MAG: tetratricopeptide repeat protein [Dongiaceae bacterium]